MNWTLRPKPQLLNPIHNHESSQSRVSRVRNQPTTFQMVSNNTGRAHACEAGLIQESDEYLDGLAVVGVHPLPSDEALRPEQPRGADLLHRGSRVSAHLHTQNVSRN